MKNLTMKHQVKAAIKKVGEQFSSKGFIANEVSFAGYKTIESAAKAFDREINRLLSSGEIESFDYDGVIHFRVIEG